MANSRLQKSDVLMKKNPLPPPTPLRRKTNSHEEIIIFNDIIPFILSVFFRLVSESGRDKTLPVFIGLPV